MLYVDVADRVITDDVLSERSRTYDDVKAVAAYWEDVQFDYDTDQIMHDLLFDPDYDIGREEIPEDAVTLLGAPQKVIDHFMARHIVYTVSARRPE